MSAPAVGQVDLEPRLFKVEAGGSCHLVGGKCGNCGTVTWGMRAMCPQCWQEATQSEVPIGKRGKLYSSTTVRHAPQGFSAPYLMGVIDLDEGLRVIARVLAESATPPKDAVVSLEAGVLAVNEQGAEIVGPIYRVQVS
jgi:uncharacterized OB-fold protein